MNLELAGLEALRFLIQEELGEEIVSALAIHFDRRLFFLGGLEERNPTGRAARGFHISLPPAKREISASSGLC